MSLVKLGTPVCFAGSSEMGIEELIRYAADLSKKGGFVELFDARAEIYPRLLPAYLGAMVRHHEGILGSNSVAKEILMLVCGKMNISNAIRECGIASSSHFICLASSRGIARKFMRKGNIKNIGVVKLVADKEAAQRVAIIPILDS